MISRVFYNSLDDTTEAVRGLNPTLLHSFEASCFDGHYVTPEVDAAYLSELELQRGRGRVGAICNDTVGVKNELQLQRLEATESRSEDKQLSSTDSNISTLGGGMCESIHNDA